MANQRMYLKCRSCGAEKMVAKRLAGAFHTIDLPAENSWDAWFEKHEWGACGEQAEGLDIFDLVYEHEREFIET